MKKQMLALILFTLSMQTHAQSKLSLGAVQKLLPQISSQSIFQYRSIFSISSDVTDDSSFEVSSSINPGATWIWIKISKGSESVNSIVPLTGETVHRKEYLPFGPGRYTVEVMLSSQPKRYNNLYTYAGKFQIENTDERENMDALVPTTDIQSDAQVIVETAQSITKNLTTDLEKSRAIHDWVATHIAYDVDSYVSGSYINNDHDAVSIWNKKLAVCEGYSNLTAALHRAIGIPARKIIGEGIREGARFTGNVNHAWNEILVDGRWIMVDTTWDAGYIDMKNKFVRRVRTKYFDTAPAEFAKTHRKPIQQQPIAEESAEQTLEEAAI